MVSGRMSTNTTVAPLSTKASAVDTKVNDGKITSSPGIISHKIAAISVAWVQLVVKRHPFIPVIDFKRPVLFFEISITAYFSVFYGLKYIFFFFSHKRRDIKWYIIHFLKKSAYSLIIYSKSTLGFQFKSINIFSRETSHI